LVKLVELKDSQSLNYGLKFIESCCSNNIYLYQGMSSPSPFKKSYLVLFRGVPQGIVHARGKYTVHLLFSDSANIHTLKKVGRFLLKKFPSNASFFGDSKSVDALLFACGMVPVTVRDFIFMEINKKSFELQKKGYYTCPGVVRCVEPAMAHLLLPLQIKYEMEELGATKEELEMHKILKLIKHRLKMDEITVVFDNSRPVCFAGVNAHYKDTCQIGSVYVLPSYRRKGYGYMLLHEHLNKLFNKYSRLVLFVDRKNLKAVNLYLKAGFREAGKLMQVWI